MELTMIKKIIILSTLFHINTWSSPAKSLKNYDIDGDEKNKEFNIQLTSGKLDSMRFYKGDRTEIINQSAELVLKAVLDFGQKCNNEYKDKRKLSDKKTDCKYHNKNLIESVTSKDINQYQKDPNEIDRFIITRRIYNRDYFQYHELAKVYKVPLTENKFKYIVDTEMLSHQQAKLIYKNALEHESAMNTISSQYIIESLTPNKSKLTYIYISKTDHWLLNKSVAISQFFSAMAKSIDTFFKAIKSETLYLSQNQNKKVVIKK